MAEIPNYSVYHLHELEAALRDIDEDAHPEEAEIIRGYIAQSGYRYPPEAMIERVEFISPGYKWNLVAVLLLFFSLNLFVLFQGYNLFALIRLLADGVVLYSIFTNSKHSLSFIQLWSGFVILGALFGLILRSGNSLAMIESAITLLIGVVFLSLAGRSIKLVSVGEEATGNRGA